MTTFRTYAAVWSWERRIYRLERVNLPMPVSFRWIGLAIGTLFLVVIPLGKVVHLPYPVITYPAIPVLVANYLSKAKLDGKPPLAWLQAVITWAVMRKRWAGGRPLQLGKHQKFIVRCKAKTTAGG